MHGEANRDALGQRRHVGDDPDHPVAVGQVLQRLGNGLQGRLVQGAEPFVQED